MLHRCEIWQHGRSLHLWHHLSIQPNVKNGHKLIRSWGTALNSGRKSWHFTLWLSNVIILSKSTFVWDFGKISMYISKFWTKTCLVRCNWPPNQKSSSFSPSRYLRHIWKKIPRRRAWDITITFWDRQATWKHKASGQTCHRCGGLKTTQLWQEEKREHRSRGATLSPGGR